MNIEVLFFGQLRELTEVRSTTLQINNDSSLNDLIEHLCGVYGNAFRNRIDNIQGLRILINGIEYTRLGGLETVVNENDTVVFLPPIAGG
ncbi:MoaD/ThiS family protein [Chloroflexota bacterium]